MTARSRTGPVRAVALLVGMLGMAGLSLLVAPPASAHASLVGTDPKQGQRLDTLPRQVRFEFSEGMSPPAYVIVTAPDGTSVTTGKPTIHGADVVQSLGSSDATGTYTMAYRAVSADGHPVSGQITFTVGSGGSPTSAAPSASATTGPSASGTPDASGRDDGQGQDRGFWSEHGLDVGVVAVVLVAAGVLLLIARRSSS